MNKEKLEDFRNSDRIFNINNIKLKYEAKKSFSIKNNKNSKKMRRKKANSMNIPKNNYEQKKETLVFKNNIDIGRKIKSKLNIISNGVMCEKLLFKKYNNCLQKNPKISIYISVLLFFLIFPIISESKRLIKYNSEIAIKISGTGTKTIIRNLYVPCPDEIYIDGTKVGEKICNVQLINPETVIKIIWFNKLTKCEYMFSGLSYITEVDLSKFDSSEIISTSSMFQNCYKLESINLANFNTSTIVYMTSMFQGCKKLKSLDISNFNTSRVINMHYIFENCNSLTSLDLSNFNTTLAIDLGNIFYNCWSLTSIDVSNFVTISAQYIDYMFYNCTINSLNLSNFDTSKVTLMNNMFYNCTFLEELNLSSFDTHLVRNMQNMFYNCINLKYINLVNVKETNDLGKYYSNPFLNMFEGVPENIVFCINKNNAPNITYILEEKLCSINYCFDNWKDKQKEMFMINDEYKCEDNIQITTSISEFEETTNLISTYTIETQSHFYITEELISSNIEQAKYFSDYEYVNEPNDKENINNFSDRNNINNFAFKDIKTNHCIINIIYIKDSLSNNKLMEYIYDYINRISGNLGNLPVNHYINNNLNFTITIFKEWKCTNSLLNHGYFEINPSAIFDKLRKKSNYEKDYIFIYVNRIYKNYIEIYDIREKRKINIYSICPECLRGNNLKIINNFTREINSELGQVLTNKMIENNIDPFSKDNQIFTDICKNFTIESIDIPIKERKHILFLGKKEKEIICNEMNCTIERFYLSNFTGFCNCKISDNFDNLFIDIFNETNKINNEDYIKFINSKSSINSFNIFKCANEAFTFNNLKINPCFYISIVFFTIYFLLYGLFIYFYFYKKYNIKKVLNSNPPKNQNYSKNDDIEEKEDSNEEILPNNKKDNSNDNHSTIYKKINTYFSEGENKKNNDEKKHQSIEKNKLFLHRDSLKVLNNDDNSIVLNSDNINKSNIYINKENNIKDNIFLNIKESNNIFLQTEGTLTINKKRKDSFKFINQEKRIKNIEPIQKPIINSNSVIIKQKSVIQIEDEVIKIKNKISFFGYYWKILSLSQPIINLFYPIKYFTKENTYIITLVKLIQFIFMLSLNLFFNVLHLEQKYFRKKYEYFNQKYNIRYEFLYKTISLNERFKYGFTNSFISGFISFVICIIIQLFLDYFFFNIKRKIDLIDNSKYDINKINKNDKSNKETNEYNFIYNISNNNIIDNILIKENKKYLVYFCIEFLIMILIFYSIISFNEVYRGGITDLLTGTFWTFIFIQIVSFFYCFILTLIKYLYSKNK